MYDYGSNGTKWLKTTQSVQNVAELEPRLAGAWHNLLSPYQELWDNPENNS